MSQVDCAIVGGGLAGLACARLLTEGGAEVRVLEAQSRVGGRLFSRTVGAGVMDLGGQWIGPTQKRLARLAGELGVGTFPTHTHGRKLLELGGRVSTYEGTIPRVPLLSLLEVQRTLWRLERMARKVPLDTPLAAPDGAAWDARSVADWSRREVWSRTARDMLHTATRVVFGAEAHELSLLHFLHYMRCAGGLDALIETEGGAQEGRFHGGAQQLAEGLRARLGARVTLSAPVTRIVQDQDGVTLIADGDETRARRCVVAVPPALAGRIEYTPLMPPARDQITQRYPMGATVKTFALYPRPFWRQAGLSGEAVSSGGPLTAVFDNTTGDGKQAALLGFVVGQDARTWSTAPAETRRRRALDVLVRLFGKEAAEPTEYLEHDWSLEPWTRGCPVGILPPGAWSVGGAALRAAVGRIHWAGTETATEWNGYMEGALQSAERAAREVLARL